MCGCTSVGTSNWLIAGLPAESGWQAWPLRRERIPARTWLERTGSPPEDVYFIESGVVSNVETSDLREPFEVGVVGREGMIGTSAIGGLLPQRDSCVQIECQALIIDAQSFQAILAAVPAMRFRMFRYLQTMIVQLSLAASASARASLHQRLARKLLMYHDRMGCDALPLTHEMMSLMLGVRRASITQAIHNLEAERTIRARRGLITIRDRTRLEQQCGPFYGVAEARYEQIMGGHAVAGGHLHIEPVGTNSAFAATGSAGGAG